MQKEGEKKNKQVIKIRFLECRVVKLLILKNTGYLLGISPMPSKFSVKYKQETEMGILWRKENYKKLTEVPFIFLSLRNNQWTSLGYTWIISIICFGSKILKENCIRWKKKKETSLQVIVFQWQKQMIVTHRSWIALVFAPSHLLGSKVSYLLHVPECRLWGCTW